MAALHMQNFNDGSVSSDRDGREVDNGSFRKGFFSHVCINIREHAKMTKDPLRYFANLHRFVWACGAIAAFGSGMLISFNERMAVQREKDAVSAAMAEFLVEQPLSVLTTIYILPNKKDI